MNVLIYLTMTTICIAIASGTNRDEILGGMVNDDVNDFMDDFDTGKNAADKEIIEALVEAAANKRGKNNVFADDRMPRKKTVDILVDAAVNKAAAKAKRHGQIIGEDEKNVAKSIIKAAAKKASAKGADNSRGEINDENFDEFPVPVADDRVFRAIGSAVDSVVSWWG